MSKVRGLGTLILLLVILGAYFVTASPSMEEPQQPEEPPSVHVEKREKQPGEPDMPQEPEEPNELDILAQARLSEIENAPQGYTPASEPPDAEQSGRDLYKARADGIQSRKDARQQEMIKRNEPTPTPKPTPMPAPAQIPDPLPALPTASASEIDEESDTFVLARMIHRESHWESNNGKVAVGQCAYDRWKNTAPFPGQQGCWNPGGAYSLKEILKSPGQFRLAESKYVCEDCIRVAAEAIGGAKAFPNHYITNFRPVSADNTADWNNAPYVGHIGGHAFYGYVR